MQSYSVRIPHDVANLFIDILKKDRVMCTLFVTSTAVQIFTETGVLCYEHGEKINDPVAFVFSQRTLSNINSDMCLAWDVDTSSGEVQVCNARYIFAGITVNIEGSDKQGVETHEIPKCTLLPTALTSVIPQLSKFTEKGRYTHSRVFPGVVFTEQSAFATTGVHAACWTDSATSHLRCNTTAGIVDSFREILDRYNRLVP